MSAGLFSASLVACASNASTDTTDRPATTACAPLADPTARVSYQAVTLDGHYVVVVEGRSGSRVFYGTADHMAEGRITGTSDSCAHSVEFDVAGTSYGAVFAPVSCNGVIASNLVSAARAGETPAAQPLTVLIGAGPQVDAGAAATSPDALTYVCF